MPIWRQGRKEQPLLLSFVGPIGCVVDLVHHLVLRCLGCAQMGSPDTRPFWDHTRLCLFSRRLYSLLVLGRCVARWSSPTCRSARLGYRGFSTRYLSIVTYLCRSCAAFRARLMDHVRFCRIVIIFGGSYSRFYVRFQHLADARWLRVVSSAVDDNARLLFTQLVETLRRNQGSQHLADVAPTSSGCWVAAGCCTCSRITASLYVVVTLRKRYRVLLKVSGRCTLSWKGSVPLGCSPILVGSLAPTGTGHLFQGLLLGPGEYLCVRTMGLGVVFVQVLPRRGVRRWTAVGTRSRHMLIACGILVP